MDEWFIVYLLREVITQFLGLVARVVDSEGGILLIEKYGRYRNTLGRSAPVDSVWCQEWNVPNLFVHQAQEWAYQWGKCWVRSTRWIMIFGRKGNITKSLISLNEGLSLFRFFEPVVPEDSPLELVRKARARRIMSEEIRFEILDKWSICKFLLFLNTS